MMSLPCLWRSRVTAAKLIKKRNVDGCGNSSAMRGTHLCRFVLCLLLGEFASGSEIQPMDAVLYLDGAPTYLRLTNSTSLEKIYSCVLENSDDINSVMMATEMKGMILDVGLAEENIQEMIRQLSGNAGRAGRNLRKSPEELKMLKARLARYLAINYYENKGPLDPESFFNYKHERSAERELAAGARRKTPDGRPGYSERTSPESTGTYASGFPRLYATPLSETAPGPPVAEDLSGSITKLRPIVAGENPFFREVGTGWPESDFANASASNGRAGGPDPSPRSFSAGGSTGSEPDADGVPAEKSGSGKDRKATVSDTGFNVRRETDGSVAVSGGEETEEIYPGFNFAEVAAGANSGEAPDGSSERDEALYFVGGRSCGNESCGGGPGGSEDGGELEKKRKKKKRKSPKRKM